MLQSIVGPPLKGVADFKSSENPKAENSNEEKKAGSDSFSQVLKSDEKLEKLTVTKDNGTEKKEDSSSQRQTAILKFMDSFESEFGVPPTRIVEAMANLQPEDQAEAPEATADKVIGQLDLEDQDEDLAKEMYVGLLAQLSQINQKASQPAPPPKPTMSSDSKGLGVNEHLATTQEKRQALNDSLENMNQKFWMKGGKEDLVDKLTELNMQEKLRQPQGFQAEDRFGNDELRNEKFAEILKQAPQVGLQGQVLNQALTPSAEREEESAEVEESSATETESSASAKALQSKPQVKGEAEGEAKNFEFAKNQPRDENSYPSKDNSAKGNSAKGEMLEKTKKVEKEDFKKTLGLGDFQAQSHLKPDIATGTAVVGGAQFVVAPSKAENEANIRQIMNQAEYLIKKGGGEMKVEMSPEGMGKIHMKVLVQDGKVNVQMSAETQEARKTLENSLSDLKNSLAAHKLSMDHIKIDVVSGTNTENSTQNQMNQHQGSRDQTRHFWNTFNENFGAPNHQRDGFTDLPSLRGYPRPRTDQGLEPVKTASLNKGSGTGKGSGLNLVA